MVIFLGFFFNCLTLAYKKFGSETVVIFIFVDKLPKITHSFMLLAAL